MLKLKLLKWFRPSEFACVRQEYLNMIPCNYFIDVKKNDDGYFYVKVREFEEAQSFGKSEEEAVEMAFDALLTCLQVPREVAVDLKPVIDAENKSISTKDCYKLATA